MVRKDIKYNIIQLDVGATSSQVITKNFKRLTPQAISANTATENNINNPTMITAHTWVLQVYKT